MDVGRVRACRGGGGEYVCEEEVGEGETVEMEETWDCLSVSV